MPFNLKINALHDLEHLYYDLPENFQIFKYPIVILVV